MEITFADLKNFISPEGQKMMVEFVKRAKEERGSRWLEELKEEFPTFCWIADLACNQPFDDAFESLQKELPLVPLSFFKPQLRNLHTNLKFEIERKR